MRILRERIFRRRKKSPTILDQWQLGVFGVFLNNEQNDCTHGDDLENTKTTKG